MMSEISRFSAMSSRLEDVALSICSSRAELDANQPAIMVNIFYNRGRLCKQKINSISSVRDSTIPNSSRAAKDKEPVSRRVF